MSFKLFLRIVSISILKSDNCAIVGKPSNIYFASSHKFLWWFDYRSPILTSASFDMWMFTKNQEKKLNKTILSQRINWIYNSRTTEYKKKFIIVSCQIYTVDAKINDNKTYQNGNYRLLMRFREFWFLGAQEITNLSLLGLQGVLSLKWSDW